MLQWSSLCALFLSPHFLPLPSSLLSPLSRTPSFLSLFCPQFLCFLLLFLSISVSLLSLQRYISSSLSVGFLTSDSFLFQSCLPTSSSSDAFIPIMSFTFQGQILTTRKPNPTKSATVTAVAARETRMILLGGRSPGGLGGVTESVPSS